MMNDQRTKVFLDRYALRDTSGDPVETQPAEMWDRVANAIGSTADERAAFRALLQDYKFVPGGRILSGAGTGTEVTFYNCYVIPIETKTRRLSLTEDWLLNRANDPGSDSREAILDTLSVMVDIMSRGGGVGINWSVLRPKGTHLSRVNGTTSGPVSWMDVASHAVQTVTQGGSRRGAAMFMLDDWHPDVMEFIDAKRNLDKITGANVSVSVSDAFMAAVESDGDWDLVFPDTTHPEYNSRWDGDLSGWKDAGLPVRVHGTVRARSLWRSIAESAWHNGEPGVVFLERYNKESTAHGVERIIAVNPCGEQGLGAYSVCNLGSMNLDAYIVKTRTSHPSPGVKYDFDWAKFIEDSETAVTFLDNVIDKNFYFLPENEAQQKRLRRIGLGVMGLADAMLALGIRYGSPESVEFTDRVFGTLKVAALRRSCVLAQQKGVAPAWDRSMMSRPYFRDISDTPLGFQIRKHGLRNLFILTQAPTGSTSILAGVNSGIEPYFAFEYTRTDRTGTHKVVASAVEKYHVEGTRMGREWVTAEDVSVEGHIAVQAAVQRHVDSSVSKTINAPNGHTVEDTEKAFTMAYKSGLKGLAYFRDGNGRDQVLTREEPKNAVGATDTRELDALRAELDYLNDAIASLVPDLVEYRRPDYLVGSTQKVQTRAGSAYVTVNRDAEDNRPVEVFFNVGKAGSEVAAMAEAMGRLASLALRKGANLGGVANQLEGVGGSAQFNKSIPHAISQALTLENTRNPVVPAGPSTAVVEVEEDAVYQPVQADGSDRLDLCPECDNFSLSRQEGCAKCALCGFSVC
jgi:ribonucleoside-diphosphate reductase alpha chain